MAHSALLVADYLLAHSNGDLTPVHVLKLAYFSHGYTLAMNNTPLISDTVEAWQYGPVYPILYDYVKGYGKSPVKRLPYCGTGLYDDEINSRKEFLQQIIGDTRILDGVLETFGPLSAYELIDLTHKVDSPWDQCYEEAQNNPIPDHITKAYYKRFI